jgi:hypothetical protein
LRRYIVKLGQDFRIHYTYFSGSASNFFLQPGAQK